MISYTPNDVFTDSSIYDLSDLVLGGTGGVSNAPLKALLDRTFYLYNRLVSFEAIKSSTGSYTYDAGDTRKLFVFSISANSTFSLPAATSLRAGKMIPVRCFTSGIKALTVQCAGSDYIKAGGIIGQDVPAMYLHHAESLLLIAAGDHWEVIDAPDNYRLGIGETFPGRLIGKNQIIAQGQLVNRADMPRLTEYISLLTGFQQIVDDATWLSNPTTNNDPLYRSCYSQGNGTTTLRIPDDRGMFDRYLDLGRGIDNDRLHNYPGGLELQEIKSHTHTAREAGDRNLDSVSTYRAVQSNTDTPSGVNMNLDIKLNPTGGTETRPINIGKIPLIRY